MNILFFIICGLSVVFFTVFLFECAKPSRKTKRTAVVRKSPEVQVADSAVGRRFLVHIEEQMAEFLSQHRAAAVLLAVAMLLLPASMRAQMQPTADGSTTDSADQQVSPAVQKQLDAMQRRIEQLEAELNARTPQGASMTSASAPVHMTGDQTAPAAEGSLQQAAVAEKTGPPDPFSFADFSWLNGNSRVTKLPFDSKFFTPEIRTDVTYINDFAHPKDDTIGGSAEVFRSNEIPNDHAWRRWRLPL